MEEKVVLVTGASSGIGEASAIHLAKIGYKKFAFVARREARLNLVKQECLNRGAKDVLVLVKDLSQIGNEQSIVEETVKHFGRLDVVVANSGRSQHTTVR